jgi:hypothetical protein
VGQHDPRLQAALDLLGLGTDADPDQVRRAYRRLARATHPDVSATTDAAARFDALTRAHRLVIDAIRPEEDRPATPVPSVSRPGDVAAWIVVGPVHVDPLPGFTALTEPAGHAQPGVPHRRER